MQKTQETQLLRSLGLEDPLEKERATHSSIPAFHRRRSLVGYTPDTPGSPEGNTEGPGTASSEPLLPS